VTIEKNVKTVLRTLAPSLLVLFALCVGPVAARAATPTLAQHMSIADNPVGVGIDGNDFKFTLPNAVGAGNCLILGISFCGNTSGDCTTLGNDLAAIPITDNNGNIWPTSAAVLQRDSTNMRVDLAIFVLPNANAGVTTITIHFTAALHPMTFAISEFYNVATTSPVNGTSSAENQTAPNISVPSFTPGNNDANGGNLIWVMARDDGTPGSGNRVTTWAPGTNFTLLDADIGWGLDTAANSYKATEYFVQTTSEAISPGFTATMTAGNDTFIMAAVALKAASAGSAPGSGIRILRMMGNTNETPPDTWTMQIPSQGNLLVMATSTPRVAGSLNVTGITDNHSNTWVVQNPQTSEPSFWYVAAATSANDLKVTVTSTGATAGTSWTLYDITGAATSPFDVVAGQADTGTCSNVTTLSNYPSITPSSGNGLTLAALQLGQGPGLSVTSPTAAQFDFVTYTGKTDLDTIDNADGRAHVYNGGGVQENYNWTIQSNPANSCNATAIRFR
jgi:hypothetical protein